MYEFSVAVSIQRSVFCLIDVFAPACEVVDIHIAVLLALDVAHLHALCDADVDGLVDAVALVGFENLVVVVAEVDAGLPSPSAAYLPVVADGELHALVAHACAVEGRTLAVLSGDDDVGIVEARVVVGDIDVEGIVEELRFNTRLEALHRLGLGGEGVVFAARCSSRHGVGALEVEDGVRNGVTYFRIADAILQIADGLAELEEVGEDGVGSHAEISVVVLGIVGTAYESCLPEGAIPVHTVRSIYIYGILPSNLCGEEGGLVPVARFALRRHAVAAR